MLQQIADQLEEKRAILNLSYYRIEKDLKINMNTIRTIFQRQNIGAGYNIKHALSIATYMGITSLRFDNSQINVTIEKNNE